MLETVITRVSIERRGYKGCATIELVLTESAYEVRDMGWTKSSYSIVLPQQASLSEAMRGFQNYLLDYVSSIDMLTPLDS